MDKWSAHSNHKGGEGGGDSWVVFVETDFPSDDFMIVVKTPVLSSHVSLSLCPLTTHSPLWHINVRYQRIRASAEVDGGEGCGTNQPVVAIKLCISDLVSRALPIEGICSMKFNGTNPCTCTWKVLGICDEDCDKGKKVPVYVEDIGTRDHPHYYAICGCV